jgi:plasmid maintenance system antidote protein VapI
MARQNLTSRILKQYVLDYADRLGITVGAIAKNININPNKLQNFVHGEGGISTHELDQLCKLLDLELVEKE